MRALGARVALFCGAVGFTGSVVALTTMLSCGPSIQQLQTRDRCYEQAEQVAQLRVDTECPGSFAECATKRDIMDALRKDQEACP